MTDDQFAVPPPGPRLTVQCYIPRRVADAVEIDTVKFRAREAGIAGASLDYSTYRAPYGQTLITTDTRVAAFLLGAIRDKAEHSDDGALLLACAAAVKNLDAAILDAIAYQQSIARSLGSADIDRGLAP